MNQHFFRVCSAPLHVSQTASPGFSSRQSPPFQSILSPEQSLSLNPIGEHPRRFWVFCTIPLLTHICEESRRIKHCLCTHTYLDQYRHSVWMRGHGLDRGSLAHHDMYPRVDHRIYAVYLPPLGLFDASSPTSGVLLHVWLVRRLLYNDVSGSHENSQQESPGRRFNYGFCSACGRARYRKRSLRTCQ
jgi:hypothetical protein